MHGHEQIYAPPSGTTMPQQRAAMRQHIGNSSATFTAAYIHRHTMARCVIHNG
jgi:hypothetical protein